jgi:hypothetical protein
MCLIAATGSDQPVILRLASMQIGPRRETCLTVNLTAGSP